ncbi:urea transporter [Cytidiella melzeri]|nr:urea transporter [Cytidiella melzeri]
MSTNANEPVLPQGAGYGVGIGLFFSAFMIILTSIQARYTGFSPKSADEFNSASRSVKPGLIASGIVSAWTWAATLLQSSAVAYKYGISGPWWYGAGATIQVLLFAQLAAKLKMNAPRAHTWLEIVATRWGTVAHLVFMFFGLATNVLVSSMLIVGGSATVTSLTGMNTLAACFLIPLGVSIYVVVGGMRATLLCDYTHTTVLFAIIFVFVFIVYGTSSKIGSPARMHELLAAAANQTPVAGNTEGSYLTMRSKNGLIFGVIAVIGGFATVFEDQAYWQRAIASRPASCVKAYLIGGLAWFAIPFMFSTTLGLSAVALRASGDPAMRILSPDDVSAGLPAPAAASALLGQGGAAALLVVLFLAVTSATSAELIAVSSILTFDVYKKYVNPKATDQQTLWVSHASVVFFAVLMGLLGLIFFFIGISLNWLYEFMGVILGSAVVPIALCISWKKANKWGCVVGAITGFGCGLIAWLATTSALNGGVLSVATTGGDEEMLAGNLASIGVGGIVSCVSSYFWPEDFDWSTTRAINNPTSTGASPTDSLKPSSMDYDEEKKNQVSSDAVVVVAHTEAGGTDDELNPAMLRKAFRFAAWSSIVLVIVLLFVIPLPLFFAETQFGKRGLEAWIVIGMLWTFASAFTVIIYPLWESRKELRGITRGIVKDMFKLGGGKYNANAPQRSQA